MKNLNKFLLVFFFLGISNLMNGQSYVLNDGYPATGNFSVFLATSPSNRLLFGSEAGRGKCGSFPALTTQAWTTIVGGEAGAYNISPTNSTPQKYCSFFGADAGFNVFGINNSIFGSSYRTCGSIADYGINNGFFGWLSGNNNQGNGAMPSGITDLENGSYNTFLGAQSGERNQFGTANTFIGNQAGRQNLTGNLNIYIGYSAGMANASGTNNISIGTDAQSGTGFNTIAFGAGAACTQSNSMLLGAVQAGNFSHTTTPIGFMQVGINTGTPGNTIGGNMSAQFHVFNSTNSTENDPWTTNTPHARVRFEMLPILAGTITPAQYRMVVINPTTGKLYMTPFPGSGFVTCTTANFVPKTNPANTSQQVCSQIFDDGTSVGIGTTGSFAYTATIYNVIHPWPTGVPVSGTLKLKVNGVTMSDGYLLSSDYRFKKDIKPITNALDKIKQLKGVTYNWKKEEFKTRNFDNTNQIGFIAQDVEKIIPQAVVKDAEGYYAMNYTMLIPVLTEAMKEQQKQIEDLQAKLATLEKDMDKCCSKGISNPIEIPMDKNIKLYQNVPNPFDQATDIRFFIPESVTKASLLIYDLNGKQLRKIDINERNESIVKIYGKELAAGMYIYTLIADNQEVDSKRMILTGN